MQLHTKAGTLSQKVTKVTLGEKALATGTSVSGIKITQKSHTAVGLVVSNLLSHNYRVTKEMTPLSF